MRLPALRPSASVWFAYRRRGSAHKARDDLAEELVERGLLTRWQADMLMQGRHRGFHLGPYRILRPLGHWGRSKVFLAEHGTLGHRCAVKVLDRRYQEDPGALDRLRRQVSVIDRLVHHNIFRGHDFDKDVRYSKPIAFVVMDYIEGRDLRRMVTVDGPLGFRKAADLISQTADGLAWPTGRASSIATSSRQIFSSIWAAS